MARQRIGILYGTFDPVHSGHLRAALSALDRGEADQVFLVPYTPGAGACASGAEDRWRMAVAACSGNRQLVPCRAGLDHSGKMKEKEILRLFREDYPKADSFLISEPDPVTGFPGCLTPSFLDVSTVEYIRAKGLYGQVRRIDQADRWLDSLFSALNPHRFAHTLSVAWTARRLAEIHGCDDLKAEQAGLLHDCAKCLPLPVMQRIAREYSLTDDPEILCSGGLLHSLVGARVALDQYGMEDPEVLEAVARHTTGAPGMSRLSMCVCLADSIELRREDYPGLEETRRVAEHSLEKALLMSLESGSAYVLSRGKSLHPRTLETIAWLKTLPAVRGYNELKEKMADE